MISQLESAAINILSDAYSTTDLIIEWKRPESPEHGDLATPVALQLAKTVGKAPREIAQTLAEGLSTHADVERVEIAGPGYVNVWLKPSALLALLNGTRTALSPKKPKKGVAPLIVEYSSPNIAKPLSIHHILSTMIGQVIANLYVHAGEDVIHWNYIADWGVQFGQLFVASQKWGKKKGSEYSLDELLDLYVRFHTEAETHPELKDEARDAFKKLESGDAELRQFLGDVVTTTKRVNAALYKRLQVAFDVEYGEGFYEEKMAAVIQEGKQKKVFVEGEKGALIVQFPGEKYPPYMIVKGDSATLYSTRDLAQMKYRIETYHPKGIYIVTDSAQKLHFEQLVETCNMLGWTLPDFENVNFGRMRFRDAAMSTRKGNVVKLESVLDEAVRRADAIIAERGDSIQTDNPKDLAEMMGIGALVYGILSQNRKLDLVFDWDKMLSFEGNSAPYLQYTYARARSVLRKSEGHGSGFVEAQPDTLTMTSGGTLTAHERNLIGTLLQFPDALREATETRMPHRLANFLYQLAQDFNGFYNADSILQAEDTARTLRLSLTSLTSDVLKTGLGLLTIRIPDRM